MPWGKFLRLVEHLPEFGRYKLSIADDDELAARIVARQNAAPEQARHGVPLLSWTPEREQTANLLDALTGVRQQVLAGQLGRGKKPPKVHPAPRPVTALQRAESRRSLARHHFIVSKVLPEGEG